MKYILETLPSWLHEGLIVCLPDGLVESTRREHSFQWLHL